MTWNRGVMSWGSDWDLIVSCVVIVVVRVGETCDERCGCRNAERW